MHQLVRAIQRGNFFANLALNVRIRMPLRLIKNQKVNDLSQEDWAYRKLKKQYSSLIEQAPEEQSFKKKIPKIIWVCWLQGIEQAPVLVQSCYRSLQEQLEGYDIRLVTSDNIASYVTIPDYIQKKWVRGMIKNTQFSDLLRVMLLNKYGGTWLDATVFCTGRQLIDEICENQTLFAYKMVPLASGRIVASSWLISSIPGEPIISLVEKLLLAYWKKEKILIHYLFFHLFFTLATERYPDLWKAVPTFSNGAPHVLQLEMESDFLPGRFEQIKSMSDFHKLNYKYPFSNQENSVYHHLITHSYEI